MSIKTTNEITVRLKCDISSFCQILEEKGVQKKHKYQLEDTYYIPNKLK